MSKEVEDIHTEDEWCSRV